MVAVSDFSGLASSIWALAKAAAIAPMVSLERGMTHLRFLEIKTNGAGLRAFGPHPMPHRFLGVLRHQLLEFGFGGVVFGMGAAGPTKHAGEFGPGVGCAHVHDPDRLDLWPRRLDTEQARGLAGLDAAPELPLGREQQMLIERIGR